MADPESVVRSYYAAIDAHEYEQLAQLLEPEFSQRRPDRTFDGRQSFVQFMRDERPRTDTSHELLEIISGDYRTAVRGQLCADGSNTLLEFVDIFELSDTGRLVRLDTYTQ